MLINTFILISKKFLWYIKVKFFSIESVINSRTYKDIKTTI